MTGSHPPPLVLASTSRYRRELLARLRLPFACDAPGVDEDAVKRSLAAPEAVVRELARQKAQAVATRRPDAIVIGSDQCACLDGLVLDKPGSAPAAIAQLQRLAGREHELLTAVAIVHPGGFIEFTDRTRLRMRSLTADEIERYVAAEEPFDCAGGYKVEGLGITLFERIDAADQTAIMGLPLLRVCAELRRLGLPLP
ncbi:MAG TPA: nucleoside triphosphate pyrophosphatase [Planctomycetota bacterium]|nr:nucleoside triphosphate pyrophosphatase [Planctomycetota bacterium]